MKDHTIYFGFLGEPRRESPNITGIYIFEDVSRKLMRFYILALFYGILMHVNDFI